VSSGWSEKRSVGGVARARTRCSASEGMARERNCVTSSSSAHSPVGGAMRRCVVSSPTPMASVWFTTVMNSDPFFGSFSNPP